MKHTQHFMALNGLDIDKKITAIDIANTCEAKVSESNVISVANPSLPATQNWLNSGTSLIFMLLSPPVRESIYEVVQKRDAIHGEVRGFIEELSVSGALQDTDKRYMFELMTEDALTDHLYRLICLGQGNRTLTIRNETFDLLLDTDIDSSVPVSMVHAPEEGVCYVEFGVDKPATKSLFMEGDFEGEYKREYLNGFYVDERVGGHDKDIIALAGNKRVTSSQFLEELGYENVETVRTIGFNFIGTVHPDTGNDPNVGFRNFSIVVPDDEHNKDASFLECIDRHIKFWNDAEAISDSDKKLLRFACLNLIYIASTSFRESVQEYTNSIRKAYEVGPKKREKRLRQARRKADRIFIGRAVENKPQGQAGYVGRKSTHYRRGYLKTQRYGKQWSEKKIIWVQPTIVNADIESKPASKNYTV